MRVSVLTLAALAGAPSVGLLVLAVTAQGRIAGLAGLLMTLSLVLALGWWRGPRWRKSASAAGLLSLALTVGLYLWAPSEAGEGPSERTTSVYLRGAQPSRFASIVPEVDQLILGIVFASAVDPFFDRAQAARVLPMVADIYRALRADPDYAQLGTAMHRAYLDVLGARPGGLHLYQRIPAGGSKGKPLLIFLHGSAGNFKAYTRVLAPLAKRRDMVLLAPTFGFGLWQRPGGLQTVQATLRYAIAQLEVDESRVFVMGLSQGGVGVARAGAHLSARGFVFLSPVFDTRALASERWDQTPALFVHGLKDRRVIPRYVNMGVKRLRSVGARVTQEAFPKEDHFLLFSKPAQVLEAIEAWMDDVDVRARTPTDR